MYYNVTDDVTCMYKCLIKSLPFCQVGEVATTECLFCSEIVSTYRSHKTVCPGQSHEPEGASSRILIQQDYASESQPTTSTGNICITLNIVFSVFYRVY